MVAAASTIAGAARMCGYCCQTRRPSLIMFPQLGIGGRTPTPRKLNDDSSTIASPSVALNETMIGPSAFGMT